MPRALSPLPLPLPLLLLSGLLVALLLLLVPVRAADPFEIGVEVQLGAADSTGRSTSGALSAANRTTFLYDLPFPRSGVSRIRVLTEPKLTVTVPPTTPSVSSYSLRSCVAGSNTWSGDASCQPGALNCDVEYGACHWQPGSTVAITVEATGNFTLEVLRFEQPAPTYVLTSEQSFSGQIADLENAYYAFEVPSLQHAPVFELLEAGSSLGGLTMRVHPDTFVDTYSSCALEGASLLQCSTTSASPDCQIEWANSGVCQHLGDGSGLPPQPTTWKVNISRARQGLSLNYILTVSFPEIPEETLVANVNSTYALTQANSMVHFTFPLADQLNAGTQLYELEHVGPSSRSPSVSVYTSFDGFDSRDCPAGDDADVKAIEYCHTGTVYCTVRAEPAISNSVVLDGLLAMRAVSPVITPLALGATLTNLLPVNHTDSDTLHYFELSTAPSSANTELLLTISDIQWYNGTTQTRIPLRFSRGGITDGGSCQATYINRAPVSDSTQPEVLPTLEVSVPNYMFQALPEGKYYVQLELEGSFTLSYSHREAQTLATDELHTGTLSNFDRKQFTFATPTTLTQLYFTAPNSTLAPGSASVRLYPCTDAGDSFTCNSGFYNPLAPPLEGVEEPTPILRPFCHSHVEVRAMQQADVFPFELQASPMPIVSDLNLNEATTLTESGYYSFSPNANQGFTVSGIVNPSGTVNLQFYVGCAASVSRSCSFNETEVCEFPFIDVEGISETVYFLLTLEAPTELEVTVRTAQNACEDIAASPHFCHEHLDASSYLSYWPSLPYASFDAMQEDIVRDLSLFTHEPECPALFAELVCTKSAHPLCSANGLVERWCFEDCVSSLGISGCLEDACVREVCGVLAPTTIGCSPLGCLVNTSPPEGLYCVEGQWKGNDVAISSDRVWDVDHTVVGDLTVHEGVTFEVVAATLNVRGAVVLEQDAQLILTDTPSLGHLIGGGISLHETSTLVFNAANPAALVPLDSPTGCLRAAGNVRVNFSDAEADLPLGPQTSVLVKASCRIDPASDFVNNTVYSVQGSTTPDCVNIFHSNIVTDILTSNTEAEYVIATTCATAWAPAVTPSLLLVALALASALLL